MSESGNSSEHRRSSGRVVGLLGLGMIAVGLACTPPGYYVLTSGSDTLEMGTLRAAAWGGGALVAGTGLALFWFRRSVSPVNLALLAGACAFSFILCEGALRVIGIESPYRAPWWIPDLVPWWHVSEDDGCRYVPGQYDRDWPINADGFGDTDAFTPENAAGKDTRVLLLGDSFAFGAQASAYERSFAALLEKGLKREGTAVVWNTGVPSIGQKQQLRSLQEWFPVLHPQVVVLAFCMNDFVDNQYPIGAYYVFDDGSWVLRYARERDGSIRTLTPAEAYRRVYAPRSTMQYLALSRVVALTVRVARRVDTWCHGRSGYHELVPVEPVAPVDEGAGNGAPEQEDEAYTATRDLLREMRDYTASNGARLLVLLIPYPDDLAEPSRYYQDALTLCAELGLESLEVTPLLTTDDYAPPPDNHWSDAGHAKIAEVLLERVGAVVRGEDQLCVFVTSQMTSH